jgi:hypothetical protein
MLHISITQGVQFTPTLLFPFVCFLFSLSLSLFFLIVGTLLVCWVKQVFFFCGIVIGFSVVDGLTVTDCEGRIP